MYKIIHTHAGTGLSGKAIKHVQTIAGPQVTIEADNGKKLTALKEEFNISVEVLVGGTTYSKELTTGGKEKRGIFRRFRIWALAFTKKYPIEPSSPVSIGLAYIIQEYIKIVHKTSELNRAQRDNVSLAFRRNFKVVKVEFNQVN